MTFTDKGRQLIKFYSFLKTLSKLKPEGIFHNLIGACTKTNKTNLKNNYNKGLYQNITFKNTESFCSEI